MAYVRTEDTAGITEREREVGVGPEASNGEVVRRSNAVESDLEETARRVSVDFATFMMAN